MRSDRSRCFPRACAVACAGAVMAVALLGCATERECPTTPQAPAYALAQPSPAQEAASSGAFDPKAFALTHQRPGTCEVQARQMQARAPDDAWAALKACISERGFADLGLVVEKWKGLVDSKPDGFQLLLGLVALRGASAADVATLQKRRRMWTLPEAVEEPQRVLGQFLLVRGRLAKEAGDGGRWLWSIVEREETGTSTGGQHAVGVVARGRLYLGSYSDETTSLSSKETGRRLLVPAAPSIRVKADRDYLFLCRVLRRQQAAVDEGDLSVSVDLAAEVVMTGFY